jgi:hypothetical protein
VTFVGGTGRSGTHVVSRLLASHGKLDLIPVECRFHVERRGFPGLLAGTTTKRQFIRRLRGFWWRGFQTNRMRGMYRFVPRERFEGAVEAFDESFDDDPEDACRELFWDLLWPAEAEGEVSGIVEQSCDTVAQAPVLHRLFPHAAFVHVVRDGRDASASRVRQGRGLLYPRTRVQGVRWWEGRVRRIEAALAELPSDRVLTLSLDWLVQRPPNRRGYKLMRRFLGIEKQKTADTMFKRKVNPERANVGRWQRGLSEGAQAKVREEYEAALERIEADGLASAPLLREIYRFEGRQVGSEQTGLAEANVAHGGGGGA